jgi:hypothetical protein
MLFEADSVVFSVVGSSNRNGLGVDIGVRLEQCSACRSMAHECAAIWAAYS